MPYQVALTVVAPVRPGAVDDLKQLLATMGDGVANGSIIDFGALTGVHFARLILVDEDRDHSGETLPASLILLSDLDVSRPCGRPFAGWRTHSTHCTGRPPDGVARRLASKGG